jgi:hypothetical protein
LVRCKDTGRIGGNPEMEAALMVGTCLATG